jgi:hypothetical protein
VKSRSILIALVVAVLLLLLVLYLERREQAQPPAQETPVAQSTPATPPATATRPADTAAAPENQPATATAQSRDVAEDATLTLIGWNVESGGALQPVVADRITAFDDVDIWGLVEVNAIDAEAFEFAAEKDEGADFKTLLGTTGAADRMQLIWDDARFDQTGGGELHEIGLGGRAPVYVQLFDHASGAEFIAMVNHLHRSNNDIRYRQAQLLNAWAADQPLPVIALGDYNFDWELEDGERDHDRGYDEITANRVFVWVRPAELVTTQCSGWPCRYRSVLDFVFVSGAAQQWQATAEIVVAPGDFPDDNTTPDHRPVRVVLHPGASGTPVAQATPTAKGSANLHAGPGESYPVTGRSHDGEPLMIVAQDESGNWLQLDSGAWIATFFVNNPPRGLPVVAVTPQPTEGARGGLRLGELHYDGAIPQIESDEYIEVINQGPPLDVAGWVLQDDDGNSFTFPAYTMGPGAACRVYTNELHPDTCGFSFGVNRSIWTNSGDVAVLLDPQGREVDRACWGSGCP